MKKLWYYMRGNRLTAGLTIVFLMLQVFCTLILPYETAQAVNIGIGQGGLTSALADSVSEAGMERLLLLMTQEEQDAVRNDYVFDGSCYQKEKLTAREEESLLELMAPMMVAVYALRNEGADYEEVLGALYVPRGIDPFMILAGLPQETRLSLTDDARKQIRQIPEHLITQAAVNFTLQDLREQGIDTEELQRDYLIRCFLVMIAAALTGFVCAVLASWFAAKSAAGFTIRLRQTLFERVLEQEEQSDSIASLAVLTGSDTAVLQRACKRILSDWSYALLLAAGSAAWGFYLNQKLGWILAGTILAAVIGMILMLLFAVRHGSRAMEQKRVLYRMGRESFRGVLTIRAFQGEKREAKRFAHAAADMAGEVRREGHTLSMLQPMLLFLVNVATLVIAWNSTAGINEGWMMAGTMIAFMQYLLLVILALLQAGTGAYDVPEAVAAGTAIRTWLERTGGSRCNIIRPVVGWHLRRQATFGGSQVWSRCNIILPVSSKQEKSQILLPKLPVKAGSCICIIGRTGSGKSTVLKEIARQMGDTGNRGDSEEETVRTKCAPTAWVPQQPVLFGGTIAWNLCFGKEDATEETLWQALYVAGADFVRKLPEGLETVLAPKGENLSGGQRQRLAIARAVVRDPALYFMDDSFSALDSATAKLVCQRLRHFAEKSVLVLVTSRVEVLDQADLILEIQNGQVADYGTADEMKLRSSLYREMQKCREDVANE